MLISEKFEVVYWKTEEHRKQEISDLVSNNMKIGDAAFPFKQIVDQQGMVRAEVLNNANNQELFSEKVVFCWT